MKNQIRLLSLIAMIVTSIGLCLPEANADTRRARRPVRLASRPKIKKECSVLGCGVLGKCGKCKAKEKLSLMEVNAKKPVERLAQVPTIQPEPLHITREATEPSSVPYTSVISSVAAPEPASVIEAPTTVEAYPPSDPAYTVSAESFYVDYSKSCDDCGSMTCDGGCDAITTSVTDPYLPFSANTGVGCADGSCLSGDCLDGGCFESPDIEMGFAERLWVNACCEPERTDYIALFGGLAEIRDFEQSNPVPVRGSFENGWLAGISKGRYLSQYFRTELEYTYREASGDHFNFNGTPGTWDGDLSAHTLMFNAIFEANFGRLSHIKPYVGAGVGLAYFDADLLTNSLTDIEIDDPQLAWQAIAGVNFSISNSVDLFAEYRFTRTEELELENAATGAIVGSADPEFASYLIGLRFYR